MTDVIVIGGGHAGCEAALAAARLGLRVTLFAISLDSIAMMPCNPCVGGSAKGHLVREIDAMGGAMGKAADAVFLQSRMLNRSKGPAVYSLRAQTDKRRYSAYMKRVLEAEPRVSVRQSEITDIITENGRVAGVRGESGAVWPCRAVIVCAGTYLAARCLYGETVTLTGPNGLRAAGKLSGSLRALGFELMRFKTGTPARLRRRGIDFSQMEIQRGDEKLVPFSFETDPAAIARPQLPCYLTYTTPETHAIIRAQIHRSPLYAGVIEGQGTRYCPSIEDKVMRFADKDRHPVFLEPEGEDTDEMYAQGLSSSLPEDVQIAAYRSVPGLERCEFTRNAYAIEYDCIDATRLKLSLESKEIPGLFFAGQVNGSSGYEEAAAQGLMAGANAALALLGREPLVLDRSQAYIGVLLDDLVTKGTREPYRMMTSRAEYRLLLRQDNADARLTPLAHAVGLVTDARYTAYERKAAWVARETTRLARTVLTPQTANPLLAALDSAALQTGAKLTELIKRPELSYAALAPADPNRPARPADCPPFVWDAVCEQVNIQVKYEGYIQMQTAQAEAFRKMEQLRLPEDMDYQTIGGLRLEARQKLSALRPATVGQASRITGVSPADMQVLLVVLKARRKAPS